MGCCDATGTMLLCHVQKNHDRESRQIRLRILTQSLAKRARHAEKRLQTRMPPMHTVSLYRTLLGLVQDQAKTLHVANSEKLKGLSAATQRTIAASSAFRSRSDCQRQYEMTLLEACESETREEIKHGVVQLTRAVEMKRTSSDVEMLGRVLPRVAQPVTEWTREQLNYVGVALGYAYMMLDQLSHALGIPLMHVGRFEGSTSHIMRPERMFDRYRCARWTKHRLYYAPEGNWDEVIAGAQLLTRSLRWVATCMGLDIAEARISLFDLLHYVLAQVCLLDRHTSCHIWTECCTTGYAENRSIAIEASS